MQSPLPLSELPKSAVKAVFSDLDDTITEASRVETSTFEAIWQLRKHGIPVVIVSGRPAGWADCLMRLWPIDAMVFENGAGLMVRDGSKVKTISLAQDKDLERQRKRLQAVFDRLKTEISDLKLATDQPYRLFDFAIDFVEEPPVLTPAQVDRILEVLGSEKDLTAKLSSIHVNYWCGSHTKVTACVHWLETEGKKLGIQRDDILYCGDSPNDEPLFEYFKWSVGVANVKKYLAKMKSPPRFLTTYESGRGFNEVVNLLLDTKKSNP